jgi:hypothetical protein
VVRLRHTPITSPERVRISPRSKDVILPPGGANLGLV